MKVPVYLAIGLLLLGASPITHAEQTPSGVVFEGCAMPLEGNEAFLTLCEPHSCSLLRGKVEKKWEAHTLKLRGVLHPATSTQPRTIVVEEAVAVGGSCQAACRPSISGRGLGPKDKPQGEGGTPGIAPKPKPPVD